jgi:hypothetical protein
MEGKVKHMRNNTKYFHGLICIFLVSCDYQSPGGIAVQFDRNTFIQERDLWEAQRITDYVFTEVYFPDYPAGNVRIRDCK